MEHSIAVRVSKFTNTHSMDEAHKLKSGRNNTQENACCRVPLRESIEPGKASLLREVSIAGTHRASGGESIRDSCTHK
jgi:hypothetical protein